MTDARTQFLIQILDKIGGPLAAAVAAGPTLDSEAAGAQRLAELLNRSVQLGLSVAGEMNVRDEGQADGVHLSLAAFASPLMAGQYLVSGRVPGDAEIKKLTASMQSVLAFADNFTPAADSSLRIENTEPGDAPADEYLIYVQALNAFAPVLQVINDYAFGKSESKVIQDVAARLKNKASEMREDLFGIEMKPKEVARCELVLMKLLCALYAACHAAEVRRLMSLSEQARTIAIITIDSVWVAFDKQASMAMVVAGQLIPDGKGIIGKSSSAPSQPTATKSISASAPNSSNASLPSAIQQLAGKNIASPPAAVSALAKRSEMNIPENNPVASSNPMAFFAPGNKKNSGDEDVA